MKDSCNVLLLAPCSAYQHGIMCMVVSVTFFVEKKYMHTFVLAVWRWYGLNWCLERRRFLKVNVDVDV